MLVLVQLTHYRTRRKLDELIFIIFNSLLTCPSWSFTFNFHELKYCYTPRQCAGVKVGYGLRESVELATCLGGFKYKIHNICLGHSACKEQQILRLGNRKY